MNRASRYQANVTVLKSFRFCVAVITLWVCIFHHVTPTAGKVFERCELAQVLRYGHGVDVNDVANWVCIAQHSSSLNTSAYGGNAKIGSHGIFQISDEFWCSPPGKGVACGISCDRLRDDDISDDLACVQKIHDEHQRLSGDGFNAWIAYQFYCKENPYEYIEDCFGNEEREYFRSKSITTNYVRDEDVVSHDPHSKGKVYGRCELAKELFLKHKLPMDEIPTWVCIAQHESNYDTSAVGRQNADGSADHGLFQISDLFWCSKKSGQRKACGVPCSKFLDSDITDDVKCVKQIYKEHTRISGNGFNAWTVYNAYCHGAADQYIRGCFDGIDVVEPTHSEKYRMYAKPSKGDRGKPHGKVYEPCELADDLRNKYHLPEDQIATWVCIAKHESGYNTSAIGYGDHGIFQISDIYWCSPPGKGWACGLSCSDLEDSDISDDVACIRKIYDEHSHLSGDGFKAWTVYPRYCSNGRSEKYISQCPSRSGHLRGAASSISYSNPVSSNSIEEYQPVAKGKIYGRCELANELLNKYRIPLEQLSTWVCIAYHESSFDTSAVGRLNADGSSDHGLFQVSDLFWCSKGKNEYGKACGLPCSKLLDSDISDDIKCVKQIYDEHKKISGDGFSAWSVYNAYCNDNVEQYTRGCFDGSASVEDFQPIQRAIDFGYKSKNKPKGKVYEDCELAKELRDKHRIPKDQIPSWVCIAKHQSGLNTSALSANSHGIFHISDEFWCSPPGKGKACALHCSDLEDSDITDDIQCVQKIYEEHQRIYGNGFNAWRVYDQQCSNGRADDHINHCLGFASTARNSISYGVNANQYKFGARSLDISKPVFDHAFNANPFLKHVDLKEKQISVNTNPFFNQFQPVKLYQDKIFSASEDVQAVNHEYVKNPFLKHVQSVTQKPAIKATTATPLWRNPFTQSTAFNNFKSVPTKALAPVRPFGSSTPFPTMSEEKAKYDFYKTVTTPSPPSFTVTPKFNRLQPYKLNTFNTPETAITPFWLTSTTPKPTSRFQIFESSTQRSTLTTPYSGASSTPKPTNRFQFIDPNSQKKAATTPFSLFSTTQKPTSHFQFNLPNNFNTNLVSTNTPFWLTSTTQKPPTSRFSSSTVSQFRTNPFGLATTTLQHTKNPFQFIQQSNANKNVASSITPFWLTSTTQKPTSSSSPFGSVPFRPVSTTLQPTTIRYQPYQSNTFSFVKPTISSTRPPPPISSKIIPLPLPTFQTVQLKSSTNLYNSPSTAKAIGNLGHQNDGQYDPAKYNTGQYNSRKYEGHQNNPKAAGYNTFAKSSTIIANPIRVSSSRSAYSTTSKTTKYDPFHQFLPTTLKPKPTTKTYSIRPELHVPYRSPTTVKNLYQKATTSSILNRTPISTPNPIQFYAFSTTSKPSTTKSTNKFSVEFGSQINKVTSSTSRAISNSAIQRQYFVPTRTQIQLPTASSSGPSLQKIIPSRTITTTQRTPTPTVINSTKNDLYDLYFRLYGVKPPSGTRTAG